MGSNFDNDAMGTYEPRPVDGVSFEEELEPALKATNDAEVLFFDLP